MNRKRIYGLLALGAAIIAGCSEDLVKPKLASDDSFVAPVLMNESNTTPVEFTPENLSETYETFEWQVPDYGADVSVRYVIQADQDEDFTSPAVVKEVDGTGTSDVRSVDVLNNDLNAAMLALGMTAGEEGTVNLRVYSFITALNSDTLYSNAIQRVAIPYRSSECGAYCSIGIIGTATAGGWDLQDTDLRLADATGVDRDTWTITTYLKSGELKFRAMDSWDADWGSAAFPTGTGTKGGPNIPIANAGYYKITFNALTGEYSIVPAGTSTFTSIGLIGEQTSWGTDIGDLTKSSTDPHVWTGTIGLTAGKLKFRANDSWDNNWGGSTFPSGYGIGGGPDITVPVSGTYFVYFNDASGEYFFGPAANSTAYTSVGLIGTATAGGWDSDTDLVQDLSNPYKYSGKMTITDGVAKFRANNSWDVNWGASGFPGGIGVQGGADIPVKAGTYFITFNSATGEYYFLR
jgi:hypothetical protein